MNLAAWAERNGVARVTAYREGDPAPIVERLSTASILAVANGRHLVADLRSIRESWDSQITARRDSAVHRVADLLIKQPVFNAQVLQRELGISTVSAYAFSTRARNSGSLRSRCAALSSSLPRSSS